MLPAGPSNGCQTAGKQQANGCRSSKGSRFFQGMGRSVLQTSSITVCVVSLHGLHSTRCIARIVKLGL